MYRVRGAKRSTPSKMAHIRFLLHGAGWRSFQATFKNRDRFGRNIKCDVFGVLWIGSCGSVADAMGAAKGNATAFIFIFWILS